MSESDYQRLKQFNKTFHRCHADPACDHTRLLYHNVTSSHNLNLPGDGSLFLRTAIYVVYCTVCAAGLVGNSTVLYLLHSSRSTTKSTINFFVFNLAVTDLLLSMVLPFWGLDIALDYSWPFGWYMCKAVSLLTAWCVYTGIFFLTAMSVTRYCSVATALKPVKPLGQRICSVKLVTGLIWSCALFCAIPRAIFATVVRVGEDQVCLLKFPDGTFWLAVQHLMRVVLSFLLPYPIIVVSYLLLMRFLCKHQHHLSGVNPRRKNRVSKSVAVVVLSFCVCWFPNNIITFWAALINLDVLEWTFSFYLIQTYLYPLAQCLAHVNSCLNPIIYCLMRKDYRKMLSSLLWKSSFSSVSKACLSAVSLSDVKTQEEFLTIPLNNMESHTAQSYTKRTTLPSTTLTVNPRPKRVCPLNESSCERRTLHLPEN